MSVWPEETFARLRYLLGGLRPIETVYLSVKKQLMSCSHCKVQLHLINADMVGVMSHDTRQKHEL
jgi:hypothetical protein